MQSLQAEIEVVRHEILTLKALRASPNYDIAAAAIERERRAQAELEALESRLERLRSAPTETDAVEGEDYPSAVGFSMRPDSDSTETEEGETSDE